MTRPLIIGLGSHYADDRAGWLILDRLQELGFADGDLRRILLPVDILDFAHSDQQLVICDACEGTGPAGSVHCWTWPSDTILPTHARGTHDIGLTEALELGRKLGISPACVEIGGVEGQAWLPDMAMGNDVAAATKVAAKAIWSKYSNA